MKEGHNFYCQPCEEYAMPNAVIDETVNENETENRQYIETQDEIEDEPNTVIVESINEKETENGQYIETRDEIETESNNDGSEMEKSLLNMSQSCMIDDIDILRTLEVAPSRVIQIGS